MCALVDELVALVGSKWATTIDQPFVIMGCTERMVIFDLRFRMEANDEELVIMREDVIGRQLRWEGVARVMTPTKQEDEGPSSPSREKGPASENEDAVLPSLESTIGDLDSDAECWVVKRRVDWTLALEEIRGKRRRGNVC